MEDSSSGETSGDAFALESELGVKKCCSSENKSCGRIQVEFVEALPEDLVCQICRDVLREPHVTDCCGQHLCKSCLDSSVNEYTNINSCPYCRERYFNHLIYKPYQRRINELKVYCTNRSKGCTEVLEYKDLEQHIDTANSAGCLYTTIECPNRCWGEFLRKDTKDHLENTCPNRLVNCEHCDFEMMCHCLTEHYVECDKYPVLCPKNCSDGMFIREQLAEHEKQCPNVIVECPFQEAGCKDEITRAQLTVHLESNMADHLGKLMTAYCQLKVEFQSLKTDYEIMKKSELSSTASSKDLSSSMVKEVCEGVSSCSKARKSKSSKLSVPNVSTSRRKIEPFGYYNN